MPIPDLDRRLLAAMRLYQSGRDARGPRAWASRNLGKLGHRIWSVLSSSDIHRDACIDPSVRLPHPNGVIVHRDVVIEADCLIMQQVTIGQTAEPGAPVIARGAYLGAGAKVLGPIRVGAGARVGANAVVLGDVPDDTTAVGVPAAVRPRRAGA